LKGLIGRACILVPFKALLEHLWGHISVSIQDRYTWTQSANVLLSVIVPLTAVGFLNDRGIIASQIITTAAQIAVVAMALQLSAVSLENDASFWPRRRRIAFAVSVMAWLVMVIIHPEIRQYSGLATAFFLSMMLGEMSAIWRSKVINSSRSRYALLLANLLASLSRLLCFFLLLHPLGAFESFIWSATFSNAVRLACVYIISRRVEVRAANIRPGRHAHVSFYVRLAAFFERNPATLVVLALTSLSPVWGTELHHYALALPLMNISVAIASVTWTRFENVSYAILSGAPQALAATAIGATLIAMATVQLLPVEFFHAESITNLKISPVTLVAGPVLFGFSTGLAVFTYGKVTALAKVILISGAFAIFGSAGFIIGIAINILYFFLNWKIHNLKNNSIYNKKYKL
jgi:hypothetical protein